MRSLQQDLAAAKEALAAGELAAARRILRKCLRTMPRDPLANELLAYVLARGGEVDAALKHLEVATHVEGASDTAWYYLGVCRFGRLELAAAEQAFRKALAVNPALFEAAHDLGRCVHEQGRFAEAVQWLETAAKLNPGSPQAFHNLGMSLASLHRYDAALAAYDRALALDPSTPETWLNRGEALHDLGRLAAALDSYRRARSLRRNYPEATANEALALLASGELETGFEALESRWEGRAALPRRHAAVPQWRAGMDVKGRRVVVWSEQGIGDTVQFCRYIPLLQQLGAEVILEVQAELVPIMQRSFRCQVVAAGDGMADCAFQVPMMSLAFAFGTRIDSIPADVPYLRADEAWRERWRERLERRNGKPSVALACSGRPTYKYEWRRRIPLARFEALSRECTLYLAQKDLHDDDRATLAQPGLDIEYLGPEMQDVRDAFGIVASVDLVVAIDTSLVHVAGAMARPACLLLSDVPDWRWMMQREDSPWYPSVRLFRQSVPGSWSEPLSRVGDWIRAMGAAT